MEGSLHTCREGWDESGRPGEWIPLFLPEGRPSAQSTARSKRRTALPVLQ